jgi:hypothetical protein
LEELTVKIRGDFVTNSSSASFILTAKEDIIDLNIAHFEKKGKVGIVQLLKFIKEELKNNGTKTQIGDKEVYFTQKKFSIGKDVFLGDELSPEDIPQTDFSNLTEEEMWALINWIIIRGKGRNLYGVGATQATDPKCDCE